MKSQNQLIQTKDLFEKDYNVSSFLTNIRGKLGLYPLLNLLQDIAHLHANLLGFGYEDMVSQKTFWVLTRQKLNMTKWPNWDQQIRIKTWIRLGTAAFTNRDFSIYLGEEKIGEATTSWMTLDAETRRPKSIDYSKVFSSLVNLEKINVNAEKLSPPKNDVTTLTDFKVRNSDIDQNKHVNNTKYAQWVLDAIPFELHHQFELTEYSVNFLAETKLNDSIKIQNGPRYKDGGNSFHTLFQGLRETDSKVVFVANLAVKKINSASN